MHLANFHYLLNRVSQLNIDAVDDIGHDTNCLPLFIRKGIAMACFFYARGLALGRGILQDVEEAKIYYSRVV